MKSMLLPIVISAGLLSLTGCGGGGSSTPAAASSGGTSITGNVVKGPVNGSQVCAYAVTANAKGVQSGTCVQTDSSGFYTLNVPALLGDLFIEASGGSYTDEVSGLQATLPSGSVMTALVAANGANSVAMVTPLTTLAINSALAGGTLSTAAYQAAMTQLVSSLSLPAGIDLATTAPVFGAGINGYGTALTAISTMLGNGTTLASLLAGVASPSVIAAYTTAAAGVTIPPVVVPPSTAGAVSASGTLTLTGAGNNFTPAATGFTVEVDSTSVKYKFTRGVTYANGSTSTARVEIDYSNASNPTVYYYDALVSYSTYYACTSGCGVSISTPAGATHPVTVTLTNTPLTGGRTLSGSLVGEAAGAAWASADLPRSTSAQLTLAGVAAPIKSASYVVTASVPSATIALADGSSLSVSNGTILRIAAAGVVTPAFLYQQCSSSCGLTVTESASGLTVVFANSTLAVGQQLSGTIFIGKTQGTVTVGTLGNFTPVSDSINSSNDTRTIVFSVLGTSAQAGISLLSVKVRGSNVIEVTAVSSIATGLNSCYETAYTTGGIPACVGATVAADGRTVTFSNTALSGSISMNGTLTARGQ